MTAELRRCQDTACGLEVESTGHHDQRNRRNNGEWNKEAQNSWDLTEFMVMLPTEKSETGEEKLRSWKKYTEFHCLIHLKWSYAGGDIQ